MPRLRAEACFSHCLAKAVKISLMVSTGGPAALALLLRYVTQIVIGLFPNRNWQVKANLR